MNRRQTIQQLATGTLLAGIGGFHFYSCQTDKYEPSFFDKESYQMLTAFAECMLPSCDESPGATAVGVPVFLDQYIPVCQGKEVQQQVKDAVQEFAATVDKTYKTEFRKLSEDKQIQALDQLALLEIAGLEKLRSLILFAYFTSKEGMTIALRYDPVPGKYVGHIPLDDDDKAWAI